MAMTSFLHRHVRGGLFALGAAALAWAGLAAAQSRPTVQHDATQQRMQWQQNTSQQQISNQLRDNRIAEQQRQQISDSIKRPYANNAGTTQQIEQADQARRNAYQSRQQSVLDSYQNAVTPQPVERSARSSGDGSGHGKPSGG